MSPAALPYADLPARLQTLQAQQRAAYVYQARHPGTQAGASLKLWAAVYEVRAALAEQNPAWAATQLPKWGQAVTAGVGLPLVPAGVWVALDEAGPGKITLSLAVAGPVTLTVLAPGATTPFSPLVVQQPTRATTIFDARADGIYRVTLTVGGVTLATLYVVVPRAEFRRFREYSRALYFGAGDTLPRPTELYCAFLARLVAAEAAARTGQPALAARLLDSARALPLPTRPVGLFPFRAP